MLIIDYSGGAVAQLGERLNGIQEADGSIPFSSTIYPLISGVIRNPFTGTPEHIFPVKTLPRQNNP